MADAWPGGPAVCIIAHSHPDFSKGGGETAAHRQFQTQRQAGQRAVFVAASDLGAQVGGRLIAAPIMPLGEDEHVFFIQGMAADRLGWDDADRRREVVDFLAGLGSTVYHFHHYWRIGVDLIHDLMEARPDATFVITLHEMLAICLHHGQMVKTRSRELCRRETPLACLACFPDQTLDRLTVRKATLLSVLQRFDHVIYPSDFIRARYQDWGLTARSSVLENYLGDALAALPRLPADTARLAPRFAFFGRPTAFKGLDVLLRALPLALRENPAVTLSVFGADQEEVARIHPDLAKPIEAMSGSLFFAGRYDPADAVDLMRSVGWVVVPSIWWENSPVVIQEAKCAGTPLIVSDIGGMAEKVTPEVDGLHFRRGSPPDLARVMCEAADPARRAALGASVTGSIGREAFLGGLAHAYGTGDSLSRAAE